MNIEHIMTKSIVAIRMDDTLSHVNSLFNSHKFHHLLVVENATLVGVLSDRDLCKALSPNIGSGSETVKVFNQTRVSCIPIVDDTMSPVGILSWRDVFLHIESSQLQRQLNNSK